MSISLHTSEHTRFTSRTPTAKPTAVSTPRHPTVLCVLSPHPHPTARRKRTAFSSTRIIPTLRRHETMLFGDALNPVPCQSHENHAEILDESSEEERGGTQSSMGTSQESVAPKES